MTAVSCGITVAEMQALERHAIETVGIPASVLMENAGRAVAEEVRRRSGGGRILVVCGPGANGGDGFVAARHLANSGEAVTVMAFEPGRLSGEALRNYRALPHYDLDLREAHPGEIDALKALLPGAALVVDALFGTGLRGPVRPPWDGILEAINAAGRPVVSADIPSGLVPGSPEVPGPAVRAASTVTMHAPKLGMERHPGLTGTVIVADIGIPRRPPRAPAP